MEQLIYNRTLADVKTFEELRNKGYSNMNSSERLTWDMGTMRGAYNIDDLNRVGRALNYLRDRLAAAGYLGSNAFTARENWTRADVPTVSSFRYYLNCVKTVRGAIAVYKTTPRAPDDDRMIDYSEANDIEELLTDIDGLITNMLAARNFCGDLYSGEV